MRETYTTLQTIAHGYTQTKTSDTTVNAFIKHEIGITTKFIFGKLQGYVDQKKRTATTVSGQQYYHKPLDLASVMSVIITIGSKDYVLNSVEGSDTWANFNAVTFSGSAIPSLYYEERDQIGIWPIPQDAYTLTIVYNYFLKNMSVEDYTTGTVTATNGLVTITGSSTVFTSAMVNRWFKGPDGLFYRIAGQNSTTSIVLESAYEGVTEAGASYTIGESPEIPPDLHELISYRVASLYFAGMRKDAATAVFWNNMFWTGDGTNNSRAKETAEGGLLGAIAHYEDSGSKSSIVYLRKNARNANDPFEERVWGTTLSVS